MPPLAVAQVQEFLGRVTDGRLRVKDYYDVHTPLRDILKPYAASARRAGIVDIDFLVLSLITELREKMPGLPEPPVDVKESRR